MSQPMLEEITLPGNAEFFCCPFLPFTDNQFERFARWRKRQQRMQMVRHEQEQIRPPQELFLPVTDGFKQSLGDDVGQRELIFETFFAFDADEIYFLLWINPGRNFVRQSFASRDFHVRDDTEWKLVRQVAGRDIALRCPRPRAAGGTGRAWRATRATRCAATTRRGRRSAPSLPMDATRSRNGSTPSWSAG